MSRLAVAAMGGDAGPDAQVFRHSVKASSVDCRRVWGPIRFTPEGAGSCRAARSPVLFFGKRARRQESDAIIPFASLSCRRLTERIYAIAQFSPVDEAARGWRCDVLGSRVRATLPAVNRPPAPFQAIDGSSEGVDLIAERFVFDAQWREILAKASLTNVFRISMKLDEVNHEVRAVDREYDVSWAGGVPR